MSGVHPTAIIEKGAEIGEGCSVGAYSVIGPHVKMGRNCVVGSHVVIDGYTSIGDACHIFQFASVGSRPQDLKFHGEPSRLEIGNGNTIREYATLQPGTEGGGMVTTVGNNNLFMVSSHVGHDCVVGDSNVFANSVALAGHVRVGSNCILGGLSAVHQFVSVGDYAFVAGGAMISNDIPPACMVQGDRAVIRGINAVGLQRRGYTEAQIRAVKGACRVLFLSKGKMSERIRQARERYGDEALVREMILFVESSKRGVALGGGRGASDE